jgi:hypothetical protein
MTAQHTPEPWRYLPGDGLAWRPSVQRATEGGFVVQGSSREREEADAKLIAAAPDLLEALKKLCDMADDGDVACWVAEWDKARAAIAKAKGAA